MADLANYVHQKGVGWHKNRNKNKETGGQLE